MWDSPPRKCTVDHRRQRLNKLEIKEATDLTARNKTYRWLVLFAVLLLLTPLIAACGGGDATSTTGTSAGETEVVPAGETEAPAAGETEEAPAGETEAAPTAGATEGAGAAREGTQGGDLVVGLVQEPEILDPFVTGMTFSIWVLHTLNTPMIRAVKGGTLKPILLTEVPTPENGGISEDGKTYKVAFKPDLKWSDGQPLTAKDLAFTHKTVMDAAYGAGSQEGWNQIDKIALSNNDLTATITLKEAYVPFLAYVLAGTASGSGGMLLPEHKFKGKKPAEYAKSDYGLVGSAGHVGNGPFKIKEWKKGESITVVRNENYVGEKAFLDSIIFSILESSDLQTTQLGEGEIDIATNYTAGDIPTLQDLEESGVVTHAVPAVGSIERYIFNLKDPKDPNIKTDASKAKDHPIFGDKNVRMAIIMGMNRGVVTEKLLFNEAKVGVTELDGSQWFNKDLKPYPYDPEKAKQMLDAAGWKAGSGGIREKGGKRLSFTHITTSGNPLRENVQRAFIDDLRKIGVEMKIGNQEADKLFANFSQGGTAATGNFDMVGYTTGITPLDPDLTAFYATTQIPSKKNGGVGSNNARYSNPALDKLLKQQVIELDEAKRQQLLDQIQKTVLDDAPLFYIYDRLTIDASGPRAKGIVSDPVAGFWWNTEDWSVSEEE